MYKLILFLGICSSFALGRDILATCPDLEKIVGCYHAMRVPYNDPQPNLLAKGIDASLCNYLVYRFVGIGINGSVIDANPYADLCSDEFNHFNASWRANPQIIILAHMPFLEDEYSDNPKSVFLDPDMRGTIVKNIFDFVKSYEFNGIVLDFSNVDTVTECANTDKENYLLLLKALRNEFHGEGFILSVSVDTRADIVNMFYDVQEMSENVNFINLMPFNLQDPLYQQNMGSKEIIQQAVAPWIEKNVPANKLILAIKLKALSNTLAGTAQLDVDSIKKKAEYVDEMKLGGVMVRTLDQDNVRGRSGEKFPLLKVLNQVLRNKP